MKKRKVGGKILNVTVSAIICVPSALLSGGVGEGFKVDQREAAGLVFKMAACSTSLEACSRSLTVQHRCSDVFIFIIISRHHYTAGHSYTSFTRSDSPNSPVLHCGQFNTAVFWVAIADVSPV